jgi:phage tail-like protein
MSADPVLAGVAGLCEEIADTLRAGADSVEYQLDLATVSTPMLRYLASWLGADLDPAISVDRQRELMRAVGPLLSRRGTRHGLEHLVEALTGSRAKVSDGGGAYPARHAPQADPGRPVVVVELDDAGELSEAQLRALIQAELPVGVLADLRLPAAEAAGGSGGGRHG